MNQFTVDLFHKVALRIFQMLVKEMQEDFYVDGEYQAIGLGFEDNIKGYTVTMKVRIDENILS